MMKTSRQQGSETEIQSNPQQKPQCLFTPYMWQNKLMLFICFTAFYLCVCVYVVCLMVYAQTSVISSTANRQLDRLWGACGAASQLHHHRGGKWKSGKTRFMLHLTHSCLLHISQVHSGSTSQANHYFFIAQ